MKRIHKEAGILPPWTDASRAVVTVKADDRFTESPGEVKRASVGGNHQIAAGEDGDEATKAGAEGVHWGVAAFGGHFLTESDLAGRFGTDEDCGEAAITLEVVAQFDPPFRDPVLFWITGAGDEGDAGAADGAEKLLLPGAFRGPWSQIPFDRLPRDLKVIEELEKVFLHMIDGAFREVMVIDDPVELSGAGRIETDLHRSSAEGS